MSQRTDDAIRLRVAATLDQAELAAGIDRCDDAAALLAEARGLDPAAAAAPDLARRIERCRAAAAAAAAPTRSRGRRGRRPAAPALSEARRRELADLYQRGVQALEERSQRGCRPLLGDGLGGRRRLRRASATTCCRST